VEPDLARLTRTGGPSGGGTAKDNRLFVEAVLYRDRAGLPWRDLPERFGDFRVIHPRHMRWSKSGVWQRLFEQLAAEADNEYAMIDSTIVRAHQHAAGAKNGMSRPLEGRGEYQNPYDLRRTGQPARLSSLGDIRFTQECRATLGRSHGKSVERVWELRG